MFTIEHKTLASQEVIQVSAPDKSTWFSVFPNYGGTLHEWVSQNQSLLETAYNEDSWKKRTENAFSGVQMCPFPNRIAGGEYSWQGKKHQLATNDPAADNAIHGLVFNQPFKIIDTDADKGVLKLSLEYDGNMDGYPFPFHLENTYQLLENGILVNTKIINLASQNIPVGHGWHPYFSVGEAIDDAHFQTSATAFYPVGKGYIPTEEEQVYDRFKELEPIGNYTIDHCFKATQHSEKATLFFPPKNILVKLISSSYDYLQVYIPKHRKSIAIEPQSCIPNAFNNTIGLIELSPNESISFDMKITVEHL